VKDLLNVSEEAAQTETNNSSVNNEDYVNNSNTDNNSKDMANDHSSNITTTESPKEVQPN
jgi:hypothetical protein